MPSRCSCRCASRGSAATRWRHREVACAGRRIRLPSSPVDYRRVHRQSGEHRADDATDLESERAPFCLRLRRPATGQRIPSLRCNELKLRWAVTSSLPVLGFDTRVETRTVELLHAAWMSANNLAGGEGGIRTLETPQRA